MSKGAADRCAISFRVQDYEDLIEGLDGIDYTTKLTDEIKRYEDLRLRLVRGLSAARDRGVAAKTETDLL